MPPKRSACISRVTPNAKRIRQHRRKKDEENEKRENEGHEEIDQDRQQNINLALCPALSYPRTNFVATSDITVNNFHNMETPTVMVSGQRDGSAISCKKDNSESVVTILESIASIIDETSEGQSSKVDLTGKADQSKTADLNPKSVVSESKGSPINESCSKADNSDHIQNSVENSVFQLDGDSTAVKESQGMSTESHESSCQNCNELADYTISESTVIPSNKTSPNSTEPAGISVKSIEETQILELNNPSASEDGTVNSSLVTQIESDALDEISLQFRNMPNSESVTESNPKSPTNPSVQSYFKVEEKDSSNKEEENIEQSSCDIQSDVLNSESSFSTNLGPNSLGNVSCSPLPVSKENSPPRNFTEGKQEQVMIESPPNLSGNKRGAEVENSNPLNLEATQQAKEKSDSSEELVLGTENISDDSVKSGIEITECGSHINKDNTESTMDDSLNLESETSLVGSIQILESSRVVQSSDSVRDKEIIHEVLQNEHLNEDKSADKVELNKDITTSSIHSIENISEDHSGEIKFSDLEEDFEIINSSIESEKGDKLKGTVAGGGKENSANLPNDSQYLDQEFVEKESSTSQERSDSIPMVQGDCESKTKDGILKLHSDITQKAATETNDTVQESKHEESIPSEDKSKCIVENVDSSKTEAESTETNEAVSESKHEVKTPSEEMSNYIVENIDSSKAESECTETVGTVQESKLEDKVPSEEMSKCTVENVDTSKAESDIQREKTSLDNVEKLELQPLHDSHTLVANTKKRSISSEEPFIGESKRQKIEEAKQEQPLDEVSGEAMEVIDSDDDVILTDPSSSQQKVFNKVDKEGIKDVKSGDYRELESKQIDLKPDTSSSPSKTQDLSQINLSNQVLQAFLTARIKVFIKTQKQQHIDKLNQRISMMQSSTSLWKETAKHLERSVKEVTVLNQGVEKRRAHVNACKKLSSRTVGTQVNDDKVKSALSSVQHLSQSPGHGNGAISSNSALDPSVLLNPSSSQQQQKALQVHQNVTSHPQGLRTGSRAPANVRGVARPSSSSSVRPPPATSDVVNLIDLTDDDEVLKKNAHSHPPAAATVQHPGSLNSRTNVTTLPGTGKTANLNGNGFIPLTQGRTIVAPNVQHHPSVATSQTHQISTSAAAGLPQIRANTRLVQLPSHPLNPGSTSAHPSNVGFSPQTPVQTSVANNQGQGPSNPVPSQSQWTTKHTLPPSLFIQTQRHPAPLPQGSQEVNPKISQALKLPPKPTLKISRVSQGIVLSWNMPSLMGVEVINSYQLFAYQETDSAPKTSLWKKVGDVRALPLPMACTLTQFLEGNKYHFAVRGVDKYNRFGAFSDPSSIFLGVGSTNTKIALRG